MTIYAASVYVWLDRRLFGRPNVSELAGHLFMVASAGAAVAMVSGLIRDDLTVRRLLALYALATAAGMAAVFLSHDFPVETSNFTAVYGATAEARLYWTIFLTYAVVLLCAVCVLTTRTPIEDQPWLRGGLRLVGIGSGLGIAYLLHWAVELVAIAYGRRTPPWFGAASHAVGVLAALLVSGGTMLPTVGPKGRAALAIRRLRPLWDEVTSRYPEVRVVPEAGDDRLLRMVVEIRDAVTEARIRGVLDTDTLQELDQLPPHALVDFEDEIRQLEKLVHRRLRSLMTRSAQR